MSTPTQDKKGANPPPPQLENISSVSPLAILGGKAAITHPVGDMFTWPIVTQEDEEAVLGVLRRREMSGTAITMEFEREFASWMGVKYALGVNNGTAAILASLFAA